MELRRKSAARNRKARTARRPLDLESMERRQLLTIFNVVNNGDAGSGTLRQAILDANNNPGGDTIRFNLPSAQLVIAPLTPLPTLSDSGTILDATSEPNFDKTTGRPLVVLTGTQLPANNLGPGLTITGGNCTVKGLVINNFAGLSNGGFNPGIKISGSPGDLVQECYIGTSVNGLAAAGNGGDGIDVGAANCTIGGAGVAARNVISGNTFDGIKVTANRTTIQGNYIGVGADGVTVVNNFAGIDLGSSVGNQVGGTAVGTGNVISGNDFDGIDISSGGVTADVIQGNFIGTDATGTISVQEIVSITDGINISGGAGNTIGGSGAAGNVISGNSQAGIFLSGTTAQNNVISGNLIGVAVNGTSPLANKAAGIGISGALNAIIGGGTAALGNVIANNGSGNNVAGVNVQSGSGIEILSNSIHDNANGGIKLSTNANNNQPAPVLTKAQTAAGQTEVAGTLSVDPTAGANDTFVIQFFSNATADPKGLFEGQTFIGQTTVVADGNGNASFDVRLPIGTSVGANVTATATQQVVQNTSEFSAAVPVTAAPTTDLKVTVQANPNPDLFDNNVTYTVTVANTGANDDPNVVYTGTIDNNSTFVSAQASQLADPTVPPVFANNTITAALGTIKAGQSATVTIVVTPNDVGSVSLVSVADGDIIDVNPANNTVTTTVPVNPAADVQVTIDSSPNPVPVGSDLAYVITIINAGPSVATGVTASDTLPSTVTLTNVSMDQGSFTESGNLLSFDVGDIPVDGSVTITIDVTPNQDGPIVDTASAASDTVADPDTTNNSASNTTDVEKAVSLAVGVVAAPSPAVAGGTLTYTITVTNNTPAGGLPPSDATGAVLTDTLPAGATLDQVIVPAGATFTVSNGVVTVDLPTITANTPTPPVVTIVVTPRTSGTYTNTAAVSDSVEINTNTTNTSVTTRVLASPSDLSVRIAAGPSTAAIGAPLTYIVTLTNAGPSDAPGVVAIDTLPAAIRAGATSIRVSQGGFTISGSKITAGLGTIGSGRSATITIVVVPTVSGPLVDVAGVASTNVDPNTANNLAVNTTLASPSDLVVGGVASTATPIQGDPFVYGFTVFNSGPVAAPNAAINVTLPANVAFVSSTATQGFTGLAKNVLSAAFGTLAPGKSATVFVTVVPTSVGPLSAKGAAFSGNFDPNSGNNVATVAATATNHPGTFVLSSAAYAGAENAGAIPITINRLNGTLGAIDVSFTTVGGTAKAGVNYTAASGTVHFPAGVTSETISVPVFDDGAITGNLAFAIALTGADNGAGLGTPAAATVTVVNVDRDLVPPEVLAVVPVETNNQVTAYVVDFSKALDPTRASLAGNYTLFASGRDAGAANGFIGVASATYNAATNSVTLVPAMALPMNAFFGLMINGNAASPVALTDLSGNVLDGDGDGLAGGFYASYIGIGNNLNYVDSGGNGVTLLSTGAQMLVERNFAGDPYEVEMLGVSPGAATLSGFVRRMGFSNGFTTIGELSGLGSFGSVRSNLTSPPIFVGKSVFNAPMPVPQSIALAQAIGTLVPNGPRFVAARLKG